ncbi:MAG: sulfatase [Solirubrobacterales bacterium]|nr:sulfatase [Solirubrobacterales bacterium]
MQVGRAAAAAAAALAAAAMIGCGGEDPNPPVEPDPAFGMQPNVVFVLTDDQDYASYNRRTMPRTWELLGRQGVTFTNTQDTTPLCCPSRAAYLTGQYGHNNGVLNNKPGYSTLEDNDNVLGVWLQRAGYETAYVGKFLNGYERYVDDKDEVAPGWDRWSALVGNARGYYEFKLTVDGKQRKEVYDDGPYLTDVLNDRASELVQKLAGETPFFLQLGHAAPHNENINADSGGPCGGGAVPARRDQGRFAGEPLPNMAAVLERDLDDKPYFVGDQRALDAAKRRGIRARYQCRLETLPAVDRGIAELVETLRDAGELDETVIVFASDNGNFHGQHRLAAGKGLPYEEASHVPLVMRVPERLRGGGEAGTRVAAPTANIDLVPTIVEWSGTESCPEAGDCRVLDGRSLLPLIEGRRGAWPAQRPIATEFDIGKDGIQPDRATSCRFAGVRWGPWLYVRHSSSPDPETGACEESEIVEVYDHGADPFELDNLAVVAPDLPRVVDATEDLEALTDQLADCAGIEGRDPVPESGHYCR